MNSRIPINNAANKRKLAKVKSLLKPIPEVKEAAAKRDIKKEKQEMLDWLNSVHFE